VSYDTKTLREFAGNMYSGKQNALQGLVARGKEEGRKL
jgi:hypothetical protein